MPFSGGGQGTVKVAAEPVATRASFKLRTKRDAARIGPTVWDEEGPIPMVNRSRMEKCMGTAKDTKRYHTTNLVGSRGFFNEHYERFPVRSPIFLFGALGASLEEGVI
jgi:hypothetical protein